MAEKFEILSPREHVRRRVGMYLGSTAKETVDRFIMGQWKTAVYVPALSKMIDEILDNSIDEAIRTNFKHANKIDVSVKGDTVTVTDNGRGIPQEEVLDANGKKILRPVAAWTQVNAGTSFNDDRVTIGTNGVGSAATNFLSINFTGKTWQNGNLLEVKCKDGGLKVNVTNKQKDGSGTEVSFTPDFSLFEVDSISELDTIELIEDRLIGLQMAFPEIAFSFNKKRVQVRDMKKYASMFSGDGETTVIEKTDNLSYFITSSSDGFRSNSFVNGVNTRQGGAYVDFIVNGIVDELIVMIKKKYKVDVSKSVIKGGLTFVMFARNFENPKFDSQTKERLTNPLSNVKSHFENTGVKNFSLIAKKVMGASDVIEPIIAAYVAKKERDEARAAIVAQKKLKKVKVAKHIAATSDQATLFLSEGNSATGFALKVRDPKMHGMYPLRGVVMNTWDMKPADVLKNKELSELVSILNLDITNPNSVDDMTYKYVATLTDADNDGMKIASLLFAFFYKFFPRLLEEGRIKMTRTPIMISAKGKDEKWFYTYEEAEAFKKSAKGYDHRYIKGLGSLQEAEYYNILNNPVMDTITVDDASYFQIMFGKDSAARKEFMMN